MFDGMNDDVLVGGRMTWEGMCSWYQSQTPLPPTPTHPEEPLAFGLCSWNAERGETSLREARCRAEWEGGLAAASEDWEVRTGGREKEVQILWSEHLSTSSSYA
jgi:hypothetical protein